MTACVFDDIVGQERVASFLRTALESGSASHAYLFVGPPGSGKRTAALALACALECDDGGCGTCAACARVKRGTHADVRVLEPSGAATYLVEQVRDEIVPDMWLAPAEGRAKVYIIDRAEALGDASANAFLKTLEEPPSRVTLVLLTDDFDAVIPTIVSRCQVVRFAPVTPSRALALIAERTGAGEDEALVALAASGGVVPRAIEFLRSPARREARDRVIGVLRDLPVMDGRDVLAAARDLLRMVKAPLDGIKERQASELSERLEFMGRASGPMKDIELRHKRELTAREREGVAEILSVTESWLRDALASSVGTAAGIANRDAGDDIRAAASCMSPAALESALAAVREARRRVSYNVSPQLAVEAMLLKIREAILCPRSWE
ncbi:MAG: AAA family ATPase [Coriobacteriia bacterium]|nr:AAA family ATPase [Coriobacteriia bacterium]